MGMRTAVVNEAMVGQMRYAVTALVADLNESLRKQVILYVAVHHILYHIRKVSKSFRHACTISSGSCWPRCAGPSLVAKLCSRYLCTHFLAIPPLLLEATQSPC